MIDTKIVSKATAELAQSVEADLSIPTPSSKDEIEAAISSSKLPLSEGHE